MTKEELVKASQEINIIHSFLKYRIARIESGDESLEEKIREITNAYNTMTVKEYDEYISGLDEYTKIFVNTINMMLKDINWDKI